jgi:hypothetical protein
MRDTIRGVVIFVVILSTLWAGAACMRWAKRGSSGTQLMASAMLLVLGMGAPVVHPPQQGIEEAREDKSRKGSQSGDPPDPVT